MATETIYRSKIQINDGTIIAFKDASLNLAFATLATVVSELSGANIPIDNTTSTSIATWLNDHDEVIAYALNDLNDRIGDGKSVSEQLEELREEIQGAASSSYVKHTEVLIPGTVYLEHNEDFILGTIGATAIKVHVPSDLNDKVQQTQSTASTAYPIILKKTSGNTGTTDGVNFGANLTYNPSTNVLSVPNASITNANIVNGNIGTVNATTVNSTTVSANTGTFTKLTATNATINIATTGTVVATAVVNAKTINGSTITTGTLAIGNATVTSISNASTETSNSALLTANAINNKIINYVTKTSVEFPNNGTKISYGITTIIGTVGGTPLKIEIDSDENDFNVQQGPSTTDAALPIIIKTSSAVAAVTTTVAFKSGFTYNPKTDLLSVPTASITNATITNASATKLNGTNVSDYVTSTNVSVANPHATLDWGAVTTLGTVKGKAFKVKMPANPNTDSKVQQDPSATDAALPIIIKTSSAVAAVTTTVAFKSGFTYNPKTDLLSVATATITNATINKANITTGNITTGNITTGNITTGNITTLNATNVKINIATATTIFASTISASSIIGYVKEEDLVLSPGYTKSASSNTDLQLKPSDTYEKAFSKLHKAITDDEEVITAALNDLNDRIGDGKSVSDQLEELKEEIQGAASSSYIKHTDVLIPGTVYLEHNADFILGTIGATAIKVHVPADLNNKVEQTQSTTSTAYPIILKKTSGNTGTTDGVNFGANLTYNPSTNVLSVPNASVTNLTNVSNINGSSISNYVSSTDVSVSNPHATLDWGAVTTIGTVKGKAFKVKMPALSDTNKVYQASSTASSAFPIILKKTANNTDTTDSVLYGVKLTYNPSSNVLSIPNASVTNLTNVSNVNGSPISNYVASADVTVASPVPVLTWNSTVTIGTVKGKPFKVITPSTPIDKNVEQNNITTDGNLPIIIKTSTSTSTATTTVGFKSGFTYNPKTDLLSVPTASITNATITNASATKLNGTNVSDYVTSSDVTAASPHATLGWGSVVPIGTVKGKVFKVSMPATPTDLDQKVNQTQSTANTTYPIILKKTTGTTATTDGVNFGASLTYNPSTNVLSVPTASITNATITNASATKLNGTNVSDYVVSADVTAASPVPVLTWNSTVTIGTVKGKAFKVALTTAPTDLDQKVNQTQSTANTTYPIILKKTTGTTATTDGVNFGANLTYNPSTNLLTTGTVVATNATVTNLKSTTGTIGTVIGSTIKATTVNGSTINATTGNIVTLNSTTIKATTVNGSTINATTVNATTVNSTTVSANTGTFTKLTATNATINIATTGTIVATVVISGKTVNSSTINGSTINATTVTGSTVSVGTATITKLIATNATINIATTGTVVATAVVNAKTVNGSTINGSTISGTTGNIDTINSTTINATTVNATTVIASSIPGFVKEEDLALGTDYAISTSINEDLELQPLDTYDTAFGKLHKAIVDNEEIVAAAVSQLNETKANSNDLANVAFSGNYNDLTNIPTLEDTAVVSQTQSTENSEYPIILKKTTGTTATTDVVNFGASLTYNPSTNVLSVPTAAITNATITNASATKLNGTNVSDYVASADVTVANPVPTLTWNSAVTIGTVKGKAFKVALTAQPTDLDQKVNQVQSTVNTTYPIILKKTTGNTATTDGVNFGANLTYNPSTNLLTTGTVVATNATVTNLKATTANIINGNIGTVNATTVKATTVNGSTINATTGNIVTLNSTTIKATTVNGSTVSGTTVNGNTVNGSTINATTGNIVTINSTTVKATTINASTLNGTNVSDYVSSVDVTVANPVPTLTWNTAVTIGTVKGKAFKVALTTAPTDLDQKVNQTQSTANTTYPIILKKTTGNTATTDGVNFGANLTYNPSTNLLTTGTVVATNATVTNLKATTANIINGNIGTVNATTVKATTVNGSTINATTGNIVTINSTTIKATSVLGSTVSGTTVNGSTVNGSTINATTGNIGTVNATTVNATTVNAISIPGFVKTTDLALSSTYSMSASVNTDLNLEPLDTYEIAFGKIHKAITDNEEVMAAAITDLNNNKLGKVDTVATIDIINSSVITAGTINGIISTDYVSSSDVTVANPHATLTWNTAVTIGTVKGKAFKVSMPATPTDLDQKVNQTQSTASAAYPIILKKTSGNTATTDGVNFGANLTYNPSTNLLTTGTVVATNATATNLKATTANIINGNIGTVNATTVKATTVNGSTINATTGNIVTLNSTTVKATTVNGSTVSAGTGTFTKLTATNATINVATTGTVVATAVISGKTINGSTINGSTINGSTINATTGNIVTINSTTVKATSVLGSTISATTGNIVTVNATTVNATTVNASSIPGFVKTTELASLIPTPALSTTYVMSTLSGTTLEPQPNDSYETAIAKIHKSIIEFEYVVAAALNDINARLNKLNI